MALQELQRTDEFEVVGLMTSVSEEFRRISHHGVREELLDEQAKALGLPLEKVFLPSGDSGGCTNEIYEAIMEKVILAYRDVGVTTVAFGDLFCKTCASGVKRTSPRPECAGFSRSGIGRPSNWPTK